jgi:hypothetical protein
MSGAEMTFTDCGVGMRTIAPTGMVRPYTR